MELIYLFFFFISKREKQTNDLLTSFQNHANNYGLLEPIKIEKNDENKRINTFSNRLAKKEQSINRLVWYVHLLRF
jgi:hypothetical protein